MDKGRGAKFGALLRSPTAYMVFAALAFVGFYLWAEHRAHLITALPYILLFAVCGGMHLFMHGGHGHENGRKNKEQ